MGAGAERGCGAYSDCPADCFDDWFSAHEGVGQSRAERVARGGGVDRGYLRGLDVGDVALRHCERSERAECHHHGRHRKPSGQIGRGGNVDRSMVARKQSQLGLVRDDHIDRLQQLGRERR